MKKDKKEEKISKRKAKRDSSYTGILKKKRVKTEDSKLVKFFYRCGKLSENVNQSFAFSAISRLELSKKFVTPLKKSFARGVDQSRILNLLLHFLQTLLILPMSFYGTGILSFGLYAAIIQAVKVYILKTETLSYFTFAIYVLIMIMAVPLLFMSNRTLSKAVTSSFFLSLIFSRALGVPDESLSNEEIKQVNLIGIFLVGMLFGVLTIWISPIKFVFGLLIFIFAVTIFFVPEAGIMISIYTLPFVMPKYAAYIVMFTFFSYFHKLMRGKRVLKIVTADAFVLIFAILIMLGGVFSANAELSGESTLLLLCFVAEYFLIVNLIRNSEWLRRTVMAIITTSMLVAILGICQYVFETFDISFGNIYIKPAINFAMSSLKNKTVFTDILILAFPFFLATTKSARTAVGKIFMFSLLCIPFTCVVLSFSRGAWLGLAIGIVLFEVLINRKSILVFAPITAIFAVTIRFLPQSAIDKVTEYIKFGDEPLSYRMDVWSGTADLIKDNFFAGLGNGSGIFETYYPMYAKAGAESATSAYNLYLQLVVAIGVIGLIAFLLMIYFLFCTCAAFVKDRKVKNTFQMSVMICGVTSILSLLSQGALESVFYNYRIFLLFFIVAGIIIASGRCMQIEDYNNKQVSGPQATIVYKERKKLLK